MRAGTGLTVQEGAAKDHARIVTMQLDLETFMMMRTDETYVTVVSTRYWYLYNSQCCYEDRAYDDDSPSSSGTTTSFSCKSFANVPS